MSEQAHEIMFHVSTLLPIENNRQQVILTRCLYYISYNVMLCNMYYYITLLSSHARIAREYNFVLHRHNIAGTNSLIGVVLIICVPIYCVYGCYISSMKHYIV